MIRFLSDGMFSYLPPSTGGETVKEGYLVTTTESTEKVRKLPKRVLLHLLNCQVKYYSPYTNLSGYTMSQPPEKKTAMSALDQLKKNTVVVADSGDIKGKTGVKFWASV